MKSKKHAIGAMLLVFMLYIGVFAGTTGAAVEITKYPSYKVGDYFKYDMDADGMARMMVKQMQMGDNVSINVTYVYAEMKFTKTETLEIDGNSYDCIVSTMTLEMNIEISGSQYGMNFTSEIHVIIKENTWITRNEVKEVKSESIQYMYMNMTMMGQKVYTEIKSTTDSIYDPPVSQYKLPVKVGDSWQTITQKKIHSKNMQRTNGGAWQTFEHNTTQQTTVMYEVVSEEKITTKAGTFDTLKIKESDSSFSDNYMYEYISSDGIPVKIEVYSNGELQFSTELSDYSYQSSSTTGSSSGGLPGFEVAIAIAAISLAGILYTRRRK